MATASSSLMLLPILTYNSVFSYFSTSPTTLPCALMNTLLSTTTSSPYSFFFATLILGLSSTNPRCVISKALEAVDQALPLDTSRVKYITAFDSSYKGSKQYTVIVVYSLVDSRVVEKIHAPVDVKTPYIPGLLAFKEVSGYMRALSI